MKTDFQNGERLFAEDLNDNFVETDNRLTATETVANAAIPKPSTPSDNQILAYDADTSLWVPITPQPNAVLQVVTASDSSTRSTSSTAFVDASISASITPISATSILLLQWTFTMFVMSGQGNEGVENGYFRITLSNGTPVSGSDGASHIDEQNGQYSGSGSMGTVRALVSPAGAGARTYKGQFRHGGGLSLSISNASSMGVFSIMEIAA